MARLIVPEKRVEWCQQSSLFLVISIIQVKSSYIILYMCILVDNFVLVIIMIRLWSCYAIRSLTLGTCSNTTLGMLNPIV